MGGWYKRQRSIPERPWFKDAQVLQLFDYLESKAYVTDGMYEGQLIRRGSCPTTRPEIMEVTGLSYKQVDRCLKILVNYGEIIVKGNNRFSVISVCGYADFEGQLSLFGTAEGTAGGTTKDTAGGTAEGTAHLLTIEERYKDNLITPYSPYKTERDSAKSLIYEIKELYNAKLGGLVGKWQRLSDKMAAKVEICLTRFGRQSIDIVFDQILHEQLNMNKNGFVPGFDFIFSPNQYKIYLERAQMRQKKQAQPQPAQSVGTISETSAPSERQSKEEYEAEMREYAKNNPDSPAAKIVAQWDADKVTTNITAL